MNAYYSVLDLPEDATLEQIKVQFRRMARVFHPDRYAESADKQFAESKMRDLNVAYTELLKQAKLKQRLNNIRSRVGRNSTVDQPHATVNPSKTAADVADSRVAQRKLMSTAMLIGAMLIDLVILLSLVMAWV